MGSTRPPPWRTARWSILLAGFVLAQAATAEPPTLCAPDEEVVYSCPTARKLISICASKDWSASKGFLQYRYGAPGSVELRVPDDRSQTPAASALAGSGPLAGGSHEYMIFTTGPFRYVVYSANSASLGSIGGVIVERDHRQLAVRRCDRDRAGEFSRDLSDVAGMKPDPSDAMQLPR